MSRFYQHRASAGAKWLDNTCPGWFRRINRAMLDIANCWDCVLGQLYGNYNELMFVPPSHMSISRFEAKYGFRVVDEKDTNWEN